MKRNPTKEPTVTESETEPTSSDAETVASEPVNVVKLPSPFADIDAIPDPWQRRILREQYQQLRGELREANARMEALQAAIHIARGPVDGDGPPEILDLRTEIIESAGAGLRQAASVVDNVAEEPVDEARERLLPLMTELDSIIEPALEQAISGARASVAAATAFLSNPVINRLPALWGDRDKVLTAMRNIMNTGTGMPGVLDHIPVMIARARKKFAELSPAMVAKDVPFIIAEINNLREHIHAIPKYESGLLLPLRDLQAKVAQLKPSDVNAAVVVAPHATPVVRPERAASMLR